MNSKLFSSSDIQSIVKKAIVERLKEHYRIGWFEEDGDSYPIRVTIMKDVVTIHLIHLVILFIREDTDRQPEKRQYQKRLQRLLLC